MMRPPPTSTACDYTALRRSNYNFAGDQVKSTSVLSYNADDSLQKTTTYKGEISGARTATDINQSLTLFAGTAGEEKAQRTFNYNFAGDQVKSTSVLSYDADE